VIKLIEIETNCLDLPKISCLDRFLDLDRRDLLFESVEIFSTVETGSLPVSRSRVSIKTRSRQNRDPQASIFCFLKLLFCVFLNAADLGSSCTYLHVRFSWFNARKSDVCKNTRKIFLEKRRRKRLEVHNNIATRHETVVWSDTVAEVTIASQSREEIEPQTARPNENEAPFDFDIKIHLENENGIKWLPSDDREASTERKKSLPGAISNIVMS